MIREQMPEQIRQIGDAGSVAVVVGSLVGWLPSIAALLTIVWTAIRIYESPTVQRWIRRNEPPSDSGNPRSGV